MVPWRLSRPSCAAPPGGGWAAARGTRPRAVRGSREPPLAPAEAERRSLELLRSVVNPDEWEMFRELGFICVTGRRAAARPPRGRTGPPRYRYLIYPHLPGGGAAAPLDGAGARVLRPVPRPAWRRRAPLLPEGDDVLAKWMTLRADEDRLLSYANVAGAGCQVPLSRIERDLKRLERWRPARGGGSERRVGLLRGAAGGPRAASSSAVSSSIRL